MLAKSHSKKINSFDFYLSSLENIFGQSQDLTEIEKAIQGSRVIDLLSYIPRNHIFWQRKLIKDCLADDLVRIKVKSLGSLSGGYSRFSRSLRFLLTDNDKEIEVVYFNMSKSWMHSYFEKIYQVNNELILYGKIVKDEKSRSDSKLAIHHPTYIFKTEDEDKIPNVEPIYSLPKKVKQADFQKYLFHLLDRCENLDWFDDKFVAEHNLLNLSIALKFLHQPTTKNKEKLISDAKVKSIDLRKPIKDREDLFDDKESEAEAQDKLADLARQRLVFDEVFISRLVLEDNLQKKKSQKSFCYQADKQLLFKALKDLNFELTLDQEEAIKTIYQDLSSGTRMIRLLFGDVGSGKTVVAIAAALAALEEGYKVAIMAPTDILARQHFSKIEPILSKLNFRCQLLVGKTTAKKKKEIYSDLQTDDPELVIGTQALIVDKLRINRLGLVVIDEQHKFGVKQRMKLGLTNQSEIDVDNQMSSDLFSKTQAKENQEVPHILLLSATPIPRSLLSSYFGNIEVSQILTMPKGRLEITTRMLSQKKLDEVVFRLNDALPQKQKAFWICPLVSDSKKGGKALTNVEQRYKYLSVRLDKKIELSLIHGKMKKDEKNQAIDKFTKARSALMVATSIIEVGIDIPDATIIIIEDAQNFGISQLHQLRGRVGRSDKASSCLLVYKEPLTQTAKARLEAVRNTNSGFDLAHSDLEIRGGGNIIGLEQSGYRSWKFFNYQRDKDLLSKVDAIIKSSDFSNDKDKRASELGSKEGQKLFDYFSNQIDFSAG